MQPQLQPQQQAPQRCLQEIFCDHFKCPAEEFEKRMFWMCVRPDVIPLARVIWAIHRKFFYNDLEMLRQLGKTSNTRELRYEIESFRHYNPPRGFIRRNFKVRVSGKRLLKIASRLFGLEAARHARSLRISQPPTELSKTTTDTTQEQSKSPEIQTPQQAQPSQSNT